MTDLRLKRYQKAKATRNEAQAWNALPDGPKYQGSKFAISLPHCRPPKLIRAGQQTCGGTNYWETEHDFNLAILQYLVDDWDNVYPKVLEILRKKEQAALKDCQFFIDELQKAINEL